MVPQGVSTSCTVQGQLRKVYDGKGVKRTCVGVAIVQRTSGQNKRDEGNVYNEKTKNGQFAGDREHKKRVTTNSTSDAICERKGVERGAVEW